MKLTSRSYVAAAPAILAVLLVAALSYWGQYAHAAPEYVIVLAFLAAAVSLTMAWWNARYIARRVDQLAALNARFARTPEPTASGAGAQALHFGGDEVDSIASALDRLERDLMAAHDRATRISEQASRRQKEYAALIAEASADAARRLDDVRMPVHILLNTELGNLDENQEELLGAAESALGELHRNLELLRTIADIDRGALAFPLESVQVADVLKSIHAVLRAQAEKASVRLVVDISPGLPRAVGHSPRLRDAMQLAILDDIRYAIAGSTVIVSTDADASRVRVMVSHGSSRSHAADILLAGRMLEAQGGSLSESEGLTTVSLPRDAAGA